MKITIVDLLPGEEEEIIVKCASLDAKVVELLNELKSKPDGEKTKTVHKLNVYLNGNIHLMEPSEVYYFEYVDQKVFVYGKTQVYEIKSKLYELEEQLPKTDFIRVSKSCILNLNKIHSLSPSLGGRFEAKLKNGEKVVISRQYVASLKEVLGL
ncbi:MAG: LytTR family transcriptional regulator DNA-binding domain-containing protein [Lachnospiraceae bacterium]|nr:LytTR family transcriptional regulator DNA-binding domain-containing protein [Lachnospiraceae bacterium]